MTLLAGCGLLLPACAGLLLTGVPTLLCPLPFLTVTPGFILSSMLAGQFTLAAVLLPSFMFFPWNPGPFWGKTRVPKRRLVLLIISTAVSFGLVVESLKDGLV